MLPVVQDSAATNLAPTVTVVIITFNHGSFIASAIESVLSQDTSFPVEIVITEDCSTDDTRSILWRYQSAYPDRIRLMLSERNQNDNEVLSRAIDAARGRYIAVMDGDDYWTSPLKLRKQVDFLEAHPECAICFHNVTVHYEDESHAPHAYYQLDPRYRLSSALPKPMSTLADLMAGNFIQTCSVMFRSGLITRWPDWWNRFPVGDWPLHVLNAEHGAICYLSEVLAAYRVHRHGLWSANLSQARDVDTIERLIEAFDTLDRQFDGRYHAQVRVPIAMLCFEGARLALSTRQHQRARRLTLRSIAECPRQGLRDWQTVRRMVHAYFPAFYGYMRSTKVRIAGPAKEARHE